jgi:hypothetical protein
MSLEAGLQSASPTSSGRASPISRKWNSQIAAGRTFLCSLYPHCKLTFMARGASEQGQSFPQVCLGRREITVAVRYSLARMGGLHFLSGSSIEGTKPEMQTPIFEDREADSAIVVASTSRYNCCSPLESHCRKTSGTMLEPLAPFRCPSEGHRGLCIYLLHDRERRALTRPFSVSSWPGLHSLIRLTLGARPLP